VSLPAQEPGRTQPSPLLCDVVMRAHRVSPSPPGVGAFGAFLDGVQESRVVAYAGTIPIVHGRTGAVVRARVDRRLVTWGDGALTDDALYLPFGAVDPALVESLVATDCPVIDTSDEAITADDAHPQQMLRRAVHLVQRGREALERSLAEAWCTAPSDATLYLDGGLPPSARVLESGRAIGVIKSHHTLYATAGALVTVMSLAAGERSSIFVVETRWREPVASWYVRLRDPAGHDPFWGLVRVECPMARLTDAPEGADAAADEVSRWVAAEATPLALPDARWDTMAYGIRDCEVYLRATLGRLAT
jgi:hypothetical protein